MLHCSLYTLYFMLDLSMMSFEIMYELKIQPNQKLKLEKK